MASLNHFTRKLCQITTLNHKLNPICFLSARTISNFYINLALPPQFKHCNGHFSYAKHNFSIQKYCSTVPVVETTTKTTSIPFQEELVLRKKQAECSVLIELSSNADVPYILDLCMGFGTIEVFHTFSGESSNVFLLAEFSNENSVSHLLQNCQCKNISDAFPVFSRLIRYERKATQNASVPPTSVASKASKSDPPATKTVINIVSISKLIEDVYNNEKLSELHTRLRFFLCVLLRDSVSSLFPHAEVIPFGSSVNGMGRCGCDLDMMIRLYPEEVNHDSELFFLNKTCVGDIRALQQRTIHTLGDFLRTFIPGVSMVHKILHARMPILKFEHRILGIHCDVSINNMAAVYMSEILHYCGEMDSRIRPLIYAVKKWAKETNITYEVPGTWITNFSLTLLVLYFLQSRPIPIVPPLNSALNIKACDELNSGMKVEYVENLSHWELEARANKESLAELLCEFFKFLATYPFKTKNLSILTGEAKPRTDNSAIYIQYPVEEDKNICKNVSEHEVQHMCNLSRLSAGYLGNNMRHQVKQSRDLVSLLGIQMMKKQFPRKMDIKSFFDDTAAKMNNSGNRRKSHVVRGRM